MPQPKRFFDSELIARLSRVELTAKRVVDGFLAGKNRSSRHGFSVEFVDHREYVPGDDLRHLDWKVLGRMDRYYIKRYEEETNITACILLDASASMTYRSGELSKFEMGACAASALAYLLNRQRDAVGLALFDTDVRAFLPPTSKRVAVAQIAAQLEGADPKGKTGLDEVVKKVSRNLPGRSLFILISDFFVASERIEAALRFLDYHGHDAIVLHTLDDAERNFPFRSHVLFRGLEDGRELLVEPHRLRSEYLKRLERFLDDVRRMTEARAFDYQLLTSTESMASLLAATLAARSRRRAVLRKGGS